MTTPPLEEAFFDIKHRLYITSRPSRFPRRTSRVAHFAHFAHFPMFPSIHPSAREETRRDTRPRVMANDDASEMIATREEMKRAKLDLGYRDFCAHLLIPLNECRRRSFYLPWKCGRERHVYEKCQYKECVRTMRDARGWATREREDAREGEARFGWRSSARMTAVGTRDRTTSEDAETRARRCRCARGLTMMVSRRR